MSVELFVGLKIPDNTAITALHAIERMGYKIGKLKRENYYNFEIDGDENSFSLKIGKVDILVNANKNKYSTALAREEGAHHVLVKDSDDKCEGLIKSLHKLGFPEIKSMQRGVLWAIYSDSSDTSKEIAEKLLYNRHYQEIEIL